MAEFKIACSSGVGQAHPLPVALDVIQALGVENVDLLAIENWSHLYPSSFVGKASEEAERIGLLAADRGLNLVALNTNVPKPLVDPAGENRGYNRRVMKACLDFANACGIQVVTMDSGRQAEGSSFEESFKLAKGELLNFVRLAQERNVTMTIETHMNSLAERPKDALRFVEEVPGLKITYDPSHYIPAGVPLDDTLCLLPHVVHAHIRNAAEDSYQAKMDVKLIDLGWFNTALRDAGYTGYVSIEYLESIALKEGYDAVEQTRQLKALLEHE